MEDRRATESTLGTHDPSEMPHKHDCAFEDPPQSPGEILENNPQKELLPYPEYPEVVTEAQPVWTANNGPYGTAAKGDELPIVYTQQQERNTNQMPVSSLSEAPRLSQRAFWAIIAIIIVALLSVGLGVGLGVGLRHANGGGTAAPSTSPTASPPLEMGTCNQGIKYCGWVLIPSMGKSLQAVDQTPQPEIRLDLTWALAC